MEDFDFIARQTVPTSVGDVDVCASSHQDGSVTVIAWLMSTGRRIGFLRCGAVAPGREPILADHALATPDVIKTMRHMHRAVRGLLPSCQPIGQRLVREGLLRPEDVRDILGWQWLLDELGEHCEFGELAAASRAPGHRPSAGEPAAPKTERRPAEPEHTAQPQMVPVLQDGSWVGAQM